MEFYLTIKRNKVLILTTIWLNLKNMLSERNKMQKTMYYISIYVKSSERANLQRQKTD